MKKYKLGELISLCDERNSYGYTNFYGLNINKEFMPTWANTEGLDESKYKVVRKKRFVFSGMQTGRDECIRISMYNGGEPIIVSPAYTTFEVTREDIVIPEYFFMLFLSKEKDRFGAFCSDGSIRSNLDWERFVDFNITLPSIEQQRKYVDVYLALQNNLAAYQSKVEELKLVCDGYIEELRRKMKSEKIGTYINECNTRNDNLCVSKVQGVESSGNFAETRANTNGIDFHNYKIVKPNQFAYNPSRINLGSIALRNEFDGKCIVSPMYVVFEVIDTEKLMPDYLLLWLSRSEFFRSTSFYASGSVRDTFGFDNMNDVEIPIPDISIQREIVNIHKCYIERQRIAEALKEQLKKICPVLIRGSLLEN